MKRPLSTSSAEAPAAVQARSVYVQTFGCQMNEYDSTKLLEQLGAEGYRPVASPEAADLVLVNTCAIREKSEHKLDSLLGTLAATKAARPGQMLGVTGCVAQERGADLLKLKHVDLVLGTDNLFELPDALGRVQQGERVARTGWHPQDQLPGGKKVRNFIPESAQDATSREFPTLAATPWTRTDGTPSVVANLAITKGCNNFCTFCIVPYTRGREVSREPDNIVAEARALTARGVREIMLLGQNVNSYRANGVDFVELLERLSAIEGIARLRYTSPHPKDFHERLARAHRDLPALCEHLHLPVQSGSDRILKRMKRNHTIRTYLAKLSRARELVPNLTITTDLIVGFPGETDADFEATLEVMRAVRYDQVYAFRFSPRTQTPAAAYGEQVPEAVKSERLARLFELHEKIVMELHGAEVGTRREVLVEGPSRTPGAAAGRTRANIQAIVLECDAPAGTLLPVEILGARRFALMARPVAGS